MIETDGSGNQYAFRNLPQSAFPFTIEYFSVDDPEGATPIETVKVDGPGAIRVPPHATAIGRPVWVRLTGADGEIETAWPPGWESPT